MRLVFAGGGFVIIPQHGDFVTQGKLIFLKIGVDFLLDGIADAVLKEIQCLFSLGSDRQVSPVANGLGGNHAGVRQFIDDLLQGQEVRVFLAEDKITDLGGGEGESNTVQHIENNEFIQGKRIL